MPEDEKRAISWQQLLAIIVGCAALVGYAGMFYAMGRGDRTHDRFFVEEGRELVTEWQLESTRRCSTLADAAKIQCAAKVKAEARADHRSKAELSAQRSTVDWTRWAAIIAAFQLAATIAGLFFIKRTLDATLLAVEDTTQATVEMSRANDIANEAAASAKKANDMAEVAQQRNLQVLRDSRERDIRKSNPYVLVRSATLRHSHEQHFKVLFDVLNVGETPALKVQILAWTNIGSHPEGPWADETSFAEANPKSYLDRDRKGSKATHFVTVGSGSEVELSAECNRSENTQRDGDSFSAEGIVKYESILGSQFYSMFRFVLPNRLPYGGGSRMLLGPRSSLPTFIEIQTRPDLFDVIEQVYSRNG